MFSGHHYLCVQNTENTLEMLTSSLSLDFFLKNLGFIEFISKSLFTTCFSLSIIEGLLDKVRIYYIVTEITYFVVSKISLFDLMILFPLKDPEPTLPEFLLRLNSIFVNLGFNGNESFILFLSARLNGISSVSFRAKP